MSSLRFRTVIRSTQLTPLARSLRPLAPLVLLTALLAGCTSSSRGDVCEPDDLDGIIGGEWSFALVVTDEQFSPLILKTQNSSTVNVSVENRGTRPHDFVIDCLPTPNEDGCPTESCFPPESAIAPIEPGATGVATFSTPRVEGIYTFRSSLDGDELQGQFIVQ